MYGCGNEKCTSCYPFIYRCGACGVDYEKPVPNGNPLPVCANCGYDGENPDTIEMDERHETSPTYDPGKALTECLDLWGSGAWREENAVNDLAEVMSHVRRLLEGGQ